MTKWIALAALLAAPSAWSGENDGYYFAENLVAACDVGLGIDSGELPKPEKQIDQLAAVTQALACSAYVRGFSEAVAAVPRYEVNGVCIEAKQGRMEVLVPQVIQTAKDHPEMVAPRAPSAALMLRAMEDAYPCS